MKRSEAVKIATWLFAFYPSQTLRFSETQMQNALLAYAEGLADLGRSETSDAVRRLAQTSKFLPSIAEIREEATRHLLPQLSAGEAWELVLREVSRVGRYRTPQFSSPLVAKAVAAVGWQAICDSRNASIERAHFRKAFEELAAKTQRDMQLAVTDEERRRLAGLHDGGAKNREEAMLLVSEIFKKPEAGDR